MTVYVNESSTITVQTRFYSQSNDPLAPNTARYLIRDVTNDRVVRDWTTLVPAATIDIQIAASDNDLHSPTRKQKRFEERVLTVQANVGEITQYTDEFKYWVRNLAGVEND
jgi:hypothetical protein